MKRIDAVIGDIERLLGWYDYDFEVAGPEIRQILEDFAIEERLRAINILKIKGIELGKDTELQILGRNDA